MSCAARRGKHLALHQPMLRLGNRVRDALGLAFSTIDRLVWRLPAWSSRQLDREHASSLIPIRSALAGNRGCREAGAVDHDPTRLTPRWRRRSASVRLFRTRARPQTQRPIRRGGPGSATMQGAIAEISVRSLGRSSACLRVTFLGGSTAVSTGQAADLNRHSASIEPNGSATSCHASSMSTYGRRQGSRRSLDHLVGAQQHAMRDGKFERLGGFEIY